MSATLYADDLDKVDADIRARKLQARPQLKDHPTVKAFVAKLADPGRKKRAEGQSDKAVIRIVSVAADARQVHLLALEFEKQTGRSLPYHGEEMPGLVWRLVDEHQCWRRPRIPQEVRACLLSRHGDKCDV